MNKQVLNMYETEIYVYDYSADDIKQSPTEMMPEEGTFEVGDFVLSIDDTLEMKTILKGDETILPIARTSEIKLGEAYSYAGDSIKNFYFIVADGIDEKQMLNVFLYLGAQEGMVSIGGIQGMVKLEAIEDSNVRGVVEEVGDTDALVSPEPIVMKEVQPKAKSKKKSKK